jgi:hypothetical protein
VAGGSESSCALSRERACICIDARRNSTLITGSKDKRDLLALCQWLLAGGSVGGSKLAVSKLLLVGYSYGSMIAGAAVDDLDAIHGVATVSYPYSVTWALALWNGSQFWDALKRSRKPKLFCFGSRVIPRRVLVRSGPET